MGNRLSIVKWCNNACGSKWNVNNENGDMRLSPNFNNVNIGSDALDSPSEAVLTIQNVDLCLEENSYEHHTNRFDTSRTNLVIRRGQVFKLILSLNRPFRRDRDAISFIFTVRDDKKPSPGLGTLVAVAPREFTNDLGHPLEWSANIESVQGDLLTILIKTAVTSSAAQWKLDIDTKLLNGPSKTYTLQPPIYILFNPWCVDDQVYMSENDRRFEYVLADTTLIWRGSYNRMQPSVWKIGQFEKNVLECSLALIGRIGRVSPAYRGDPVKVCRALSAAVNSPDDDGVVLGNWDEDFSDGTPPTKWVGSADIIQKFYKTWKPVKYGQCWVFAGVLTTIARAIGIPSRIITNYSSAHDTQGSLTVDIFVDHNNRKMEEQTFDSIWNYHVWNEVWMERPDLGYGDHGSYSGWQVIDATPQEESDNMYRCGPASVKAVKYGEILRPYDNIFVYSEVNADKLFWRYNGPLQPVKLIRTDTLSIGLLISTKAIAKWEREDVTSSYKYEEKSSDERNTMMKALKQSRHAFSRYYLNESFNEVEFDLELKDDIKIGENFAVVLKVTNKSSDKTHKAVGRLNADAVLYTGISTAEVKSITFEVDLKPLRTESVKMDVNFEEYYKKLLPQAAFNISCSAQVQDTDYDYFAQDVFRVRKPDIKFQFKGKTVSKEVVDVIVRLENPLPIPIKKGMFYIEGPALDKALRFKIAEIPPGGVAACTFKYTPPYAGPATLVAKFQSKELDDVDGFTAFEVEPRPEDIITNGRNYTNEVVIRDDVIP